MLGCLHKNLSGISDNFRLVVNGFIWYLTCYFCWFKSNKLKVTADPDLPIQDGSLDHDWSDRGVCESDDIS